MYLACGLNWLGIDADAASFGGTISNCEELGEVDHRWPEMPLRENCCELGFVRWAFLRPFLNWSIVIGM